MSKIINKNENIRVYLRTVLQTSDAGLTKISLGPALSHETLFEDKSLGDQSASRCSQQQDVSKMVAEGRRGWCCMLQRDQRKSPSKV